MSDLIRSEEPVARKDYTCQGRNQIVYTMDCEVTHKKGYDQVLKCASIKKGEKHNKQTISCDGEIYTWRSCFECLEVIEELDLYRDN